MGKGGMWLPVSPLSSIREATKSLRVNRLVLDSNRNAP